MPSKSECRMDVVLKVISDQWTLSIIHKLSDGPRRTLELFGAFTGMSTKTLNARLKKLERDGVVTRISYPASPPRVEYSLTEKGRELIPVLDAIARVAFKWSGPFQTDKAETPCRVCGSSYNRLAYEEKASPSPEPPPRPRSRKLTDVTLL